MQVNTTLQLGRLADSRPVVQRLVDENMANKLDTYLRKFPEDHQVGTITLTLDQDKKGLFLGSLQANFDGISLRSEREDFKKLDDLINHLFEHITVQFSKQK